MLLALFFDLVVRSFGQRLLLSDHLSSGFFSLTTAIITTLKDPEQEGLMD